MIYVPLSEGELIDKITILEIKIENIKDDEKKENCKHEHSLLENIAKENNIEFSIYREELKKVNKELWEIEDKLRIKEKEKLFDEEFIETTRKEYKANDLRAEIKRKINIESGSLIREEKDYVDYT